MYMSLFDNLTNSAEAAAVVWLTSMELLDVCCMTFVALVIELVVDVGTQGIVSHRPFSPHSIT